MLRQLRERATGTRCATPKVTSTSIAQKRMLFEGVPIKWSQRSKSGPKRSFLGSVFWEPFVSFDIWKKAFGV
jgi:hypothetical protein